MEIPIGIVTVLMTILSAIGGWAFTYLLGQIQAFASCQNECQKNLHNRRETDQTNIYDKVDQLRSKIGNIEVWQATFQMLMEQNAKDHAEMMNEIKILSEEVRELGECVRLLAKGHKEC